MAYAQDDRLSGVEGITTIDTGGTPIIGDSIGWDYREFGDILRGRTAGNRATGRTYLGTDWELNLRWRIRSSGTTPLLFRRGATVAFDVRTDEAMSPAIKVVGSGMLTEAAIGVPVDDYIEYRGRIESDDPDETNLPVITRA